jgi:hypothetical protein
MRRRIISIAVLIWLGCAAEIAHAAATEGTAQLEFTTETIRGKYGPKHVLAVWVTDAQTNYVKTVARFGGKRLDKLAAWNSARKGDRAVDGVTGATRSSHQALTVMWNGKDANNKTLPDGTYLFVVEFTENKGRGPLAVIPFAKGPAALSKEIKDLKNFSNVKVSFAPGASK